MPATPAVQLVFATTSVGAAAAEAAKAKGITKVVVDRGGNPYTGRLAVIVETAVENGLSISDKPAKEAE